MAETDQTKRPSVMTWAEYYEQAIPRLVEVIWSGAEVECLRLGPQAMRAFVTHQENHRHKGSVSSDDAVAAVRRAAGEWLANGLRVVPGEREGVEVVEEWRGELRAGVPASPGLRLWLPAVHTLSQNRTKGRHWSQSYRARKGEAAALLDALSQVRDDAWPGAAMLGEACRVLGLLALGQDARKIRKPSFTRPAGSPRLVIVYTRVTTRPLDAENWCGSTKGMTDCLKYALPGLLPDDAPEFVEIVHRQVKCAKRCEEGTWVELRLDAGMMKPE